MALALFDLDNTLLNGDSDYSWGRFLVSKKAVDADFYEAENLRFYEEYKAGIMDIYEYQEFSLSPLIQYSWQQLIEWRDEFLETIVKPMLLPKAVALIQQHQKKQDTLMVITATSSFITRPITDIYNIKYLLATEPEIVDQKFTGKVSGEPCFQENKVKKLLQWVKEEQQDLNNSYFYSDSRNDIPLLEQVTFPYAVDPDDHLRQHALDKGWKIITLRDHGIINS
jgi:HAD superfamily hydrolase (TIGR01490 family)